MKFLGNFPKDRSHAVYNIYVPPGETLDQAWDKHQEFCKDKVIGEPKGNDRFTSEQLTDQGLVGLYEDQE
jgi:hypothetical protein